MAISAISGMGGVGKTELALQYALAPLTAKQYTGGICWLNARSLDIGIQIVNFARTYLKLQLPDGLELPDQVAYCWRFWHTSPTLLIQEGDRGQVLVVLDDVTKYEDVKRYLPTDPRFKVLMTTRRQLGKPIKRLDLEVLTEGAALDMLKSYIGERVDSELDAATKLCEWLGYLPLGLELVGRYLEIEEDLSLVEIQQLLRQASLKYEALDETHPEMTARLGVAAAFELSWQELDENAQILGYLLSVFALAPIPWSLVESALTSPPAPLLQGEGSKNPTPPPATPTPPFPRREGGLGGLGQSLTKARRTLRKFNLIKRKAKNTYELHQLIREFFIDKREKSAEVEPLKRGFCQAMVTEAKKIPDAPILSKIAAFTPTIPHLAEAATTQMDWVSDEDLIYPFVGMARFYNGQGDYNEAEPWYEQCLSSTKARLGEDHPNVAASLNNLAGLYYRQGCYKKAEPLFLQALELRKRLLGEDHPHVAITLGNLALLYKYQGRYTEAEPLFLQALEIRKRLLGEEHLDVALSLNTLAALYQAQGRYTEAEPLFLQALEIRKRLLGEEHLDVATTINNLGELCRIQGRYDEAERLNQQALELRKRLLGEDHPDVALSLNNLAVIYYVQKRYKQAEPLYLQALELRKRRLGENHPDVAQSLNNLAMLYSSQGRYSEAEPLYLQALELRKRRLGENHSDVATSLNNLAGLYNSQGRYSEAEPLYLQALELTKRLLGQDHSDVAVSLNNLAGLYYAQGYYKQAEPFLVQALELCERVLGENHPNTVIFRKNLQFLRDSQVE